MKKVILLCTVFFSLMLTAGNTVFIEGKIVYDIFINNDANSKGEFVIMQKGDFIKQSMTINGAITSITIYDASKHESVIYSNSITGKYATRITAAEQAKRNEKYANATYINSDEIKNIAGRDCKKSTITYSDGTSNTIYQTTDITAGIKELNAMFSEITGLPLQYEISKSPTNKLNLVAKSLVIAPIDKKEFEPLKGYRFLTVEEMGKK